VRARAVLLGAIALAALPALPVYAADASSALAAERRQIQTADYRINGHLVRVQANGARISFPVTIQAHWFPGVLRIRMEVGSASGPAASPTASPAANSAPPAFPPVRALLEMRPAGEDSIWIAHPGDKSPTLLPFDKWDDGPLGPGFAWEDFLEQQYFWPVQTLQPAANFGARACNVIVSAPGAAGRSHYAQVKTWLDQSIGFPVYAEKTSKGSGATKQFTYFGLRHNGGVWSASQVEEATRGQGGKTLLVIDRGTAKANLRLKDFSPNQLVNFQNR
jgi:Outer membrane lipoprotein-sorting protein